MTMTALLGWGLIVAGCVSDTWVAVVAGAILVLVGAVDELKDKLR